jgi:hypothetical protein
MTDTSIDDKLNAALQRLLTNRPEHTDGKLTVTNLCTEAGV